MRLLIPVCLFAVCCGHPTLAEFRTLVSNDGIKGCLVRVLDPKGGLILDWVFRDMGMKDVTWESTNPKNHCEEPEAKVEIR